MRTKELSKISLERVKRPRSRFDLSFDSNTSAGWGDLQPVVSRLLVPNSKTKLSLDSLVRMAPLVRPAFARVKAKFWSAFVGMSELTQNFSALLSKQTISRGDISFIPGEVPNMALNDLSLYTLMGARMSVWEVYENFIPNQTYCSYKLRHVTPNFDYSSDEVTKWISSVVWKPRSPGNQKVVKLSDALGGYNGAFFDFSQILNPLSTSRKMWMPIENLTASSFFDYGSLNNNVWTSNNDYVSLESADYVIERTLMIGNTPHYLAFAFRLSEFGKRLRKILIGLGYQPNFNSDTRVSLMPLFAYYKAYFDIFGLTLYNKWETTNAYKVLYRYDLSNNPLFDMFTSLSTPISFEDGSVSKKVLDLLGFFSDLGQTWVTRDADWVSAHTETQTIATDVGASGILSEFNSSLSEPESLNSNLDTTLINSGKHASTSSPTHGQLDSEYLKSLYRVINQNSVVGQKIAELLRNQGLGDFVDNCESSFIGYREYDCKISDITSTSDTFSSSESLGAVLGEQGGKSVTYNSVKPLSYENREFGYWITFMAIVPESGYCQSLDAANVKSIGKLDFYHPEYDGMGKRITPFDEIVAQADWANNTETNPPEVGTDMKRGFGFIPQFTQFKVKNNVMNGDMSIRGVRNTYLQFTGDKFIEVGDRKVLDSMDTTTNRLSKAYLVTPPSQLPIAGNAWRYPARYQFLGNFDRLFYNNNEADKFNNAITLAMANSQSNLGFITWEMIRKTYDNFVVHNICDFVTYAPMLPLEDSFETKDEGNKGHTNSEVRKA